MKRPPKIRTPDHTRLNLGQEEYYRPFMEGYIKLLQTNLKQVKHIGHNYSYKTFTCGEPHDPRNPNWKPSTIHSFCHYLLRNEGVTFSVLSGKDQIVFLREVMKRLRIKDLSIGMVLREISLAKNNLIDVDEFRARYEGDQSMLKVMIGTDNENVFGSIQVLIKIYYQSI